MDERPELAMIDRTELRRKIGYYEAPLDAGKELPTSGLITLRILRTLDRLLVNPVEDGELAGGRTVSEHDRRQARLCEELGVDPRVLVGKEVLAVDLGGDLSASDANVESVTFTFSDGTLATFRCHAAYADHWWLDAAITEPPEYGDVEDGETDG